MSAEPRAPLVFIQRRAINAGIYRIDMEIEERKLIVSIRQLASIPFPGEDLSVAKHWFNHLLFNTDASRFVFLHRWRGLDSRSYLPGNEWILNDTYPNSKRLQHVYLYHVPSGRKVELASLFSPPEYAGEWRCDTHPRFSRTGRSVVVDSLHEGRGRQMHLIDIGHLIS